MELLAGKWASLGTAGQVGLNTTPREQGLKTDQGLQAIAAAWARARATCVHSSGVQLC